jgi:uncharacterized protein (PEP-CTERM system associated)
VRTYRISPYLVHRFGAFANGELRYAHDSVSTDNIGMRRSDGNTISGQLTSGPTFRRFGWDAVASRSVIDEQLPVAGGGERQQSTSSKSANINLRYAATQQLNVGVYGGYDDYDFSGLGGAQSGAAYGGSVQWTPSARTSLQASAGHRFYGPSYSLSLQHRSRGTVWNVGYSDAVSTSRSQFLLPQAIDTASMLDNLFRAQIPDPQLRAAAVLAYIQAAGLPPSLATSVNFLSNRYSLQKQLNAGVAWKLAHHHHVQPVQDPARNAVEPTGRQRPAGQHLGHAQRQHRAARRTGQHQLPARGANRADPDRQRNECQLADRCALQPPPRRAPEPGAHVQHAHQRQRGIAPCKRVHRTGRPAIHGKRRVRCADDTILSIRVHHV